MSLSDTATVGGGQRIVRPDAQKLLVRRHQQLEEFLNDRAFPFRELIERISRLVGVQVKVLERLAPRGLVLGGRGFLEDAPLFPWQELMGFICETHGDVLLGATLHRRDHEEEAWWAHQVVRILQGEPLVDSPELTAPLVAAMQLIWMQTAANAPAYSATESHLCPICLGLPVATLLVKGEGPDAGRYFTCGLCSTIWPRPRLGCALCDNPKDQVLLSSKGVGRSVQLEVCEACNSYVKRFEFKWDRPLDPLAEDLASLSLDLLAAEKEYCRLGLNYLLIDAFSA